MGNHGGHNGIYVHTYIYIYVYVYDVYTEYVMCIQRKRERERDRDTQSSGLWGLGVLGVCRIWISGIIGLLDSIVKSTPCIIQPKTQIVS